MPSDFFCLLSSQCMQVTLSSFIGDDQSWFCNLFTCPTFPSVLQPGKVQSLQSLLITQSSWNGNHLGCPSLYFSQLDVLPSLAQPYLLHCKLKMRPNTCLVHCGKTLFSPVLWGPFYLDFETTLPMSLSNFWLLLYNFPRFFPSLTPASCYIIAIKSIAMPLVSGSYVHHLTFWFREFHEPCVGPSYLHPLVALHFASVITKLHYGIICTKHFAFGGYIITVMCPCWKEHIPG